MRVGLADLARQYSTMSAEIDAAVKDVLTSARFVLGPVVADLESEIAAMSGAAYGVGVNSGTDALILSLAALGIGPGDEVITSPFTFFATAEAIATVGARPVFADIDPRTFILCPECAAARITPRTRAIMPVDLFGQMADRTAFGALAEAHGLQLIWDSAQAIGCQFDGRPLAAFPGSVTLSFFPTKNLGGAGDGGMVLTSDEATRDRLVRYRFHGSGGGYMYHEIGYCTRLDALQAAILRVKLTRLEGWNEARRRNAARYAERLAGTPITLPYNDPRALPTYHQYTVRHARRDDLKAWLADRGVDTGVYYPLPLHLQEVFAHLGYRPGDLPNAENASQEVLALPVHPDLEPVQVDYVAEAVREFVMQA